MKLEDGFEKIRIARTGVNQDKVNRFLQWVQDQGFIVWDLENDTRHEIDGVSKESQLGVTVSKREKPTQRTRHRKLVAERGFANESFAQIGTHTAGTCYLRKLGLKMRRKNSSQKKRNRQIRKS